MKLSLGCQNNLVAKIRDDGEVKGDAEVVGMECSDLNQQDMTEMASFAIPGPLVMG